MATHGVSGGYGVGSMGEGEGEGEWSKASGAALGWVKAGKRQWATPRGRAVCRRAARAGLCRACGLLQGAVQAVATQMRSSVVWAFLSAKRRG